MKKTALLLSLIIALSTQAIAQLKNANVSQLGFMAGSWTLKHKWGDMEEIWAPPMGDNLVSTFRCVKDGKVVFYEFMVVEQSSTGPVLKLRHFNRGSIGWEEKDKPYLMPAIKLIGKEVTFESTDKSVRITYGRISPTRLDCILDEKDKKGIWTKESFNYTLKK